MHSMEATECTTASQPNPKQILKISTKLPFPSSPSKIGGQKQLSQGNVPKLSPKKHKQTPKNFVCGYIFQKIRLGKTFFAWGASSGLILVTFSVWWICVGLWCSSVFISHIITNNLEFFIISMNDTSDLKFNMSLLFALWMSDKAIQCNCCLGLTS